MSLFENLTKKVTDTAKAAAKKSGELVEVTKLNLSIAAEEDKIEKVYIDIGKTVYAAFSNGEDVQESYKASCEQVKFHEDNIKDLKQKIHELKNVKICPSCGMQLDAEIAFCSKCGAKQEIPQPVQEEPIITEKICPTCGASNDLKDGFCSKCGAKLE